MRREGLDQNMVEALATCGSPPALRPGGEAERCLRRRTGGHMRALRAA